MSRKWLMWAGCGLMVLAGGYWLWSRGYQNVLGYAMLLLCPAMHLLMHGSHDHSGHKHQSSTEKSAGREACH